MTTRRVVTFTVIGIPQTQGSTRAFVVQTKRGARAVTTHDNAKVRGWRQLVAQQAQHAVGSALFLGAVKLTITFRLPRPISLPKKITHHTKTPDLDKLVRAVGDGLSGTVFMDDKQVVELHARKIYCSGALPPAAHIVVEAAALPDREAFDASLLDAFEVVG